MLLSSVPQAGQERVRFISHGSGFPGRASELRPGLEGTRPWGHSLLVGAPGPRPRRAWRSCCLGSASRGVSRLGSATSSRPHCGRQGVSQQGSLRLADLWLGCRGSGWGRTGWGGVPVCPQSPPLSPPPSVVTHRAAVWTAACLTPGLTSALGSEVSTGSWRLRYTANGCV